MDLHLYLFDYNVIHLIAQVDYLIKVQRAVAVGVLQCLGQAMGQYTLRAPIVVQCGCIF